MTNIKELFGNISGTYDLLNRILSFGVDQRWRKRGINFLPSGKEIKILDLASGTLDLSLHFLGKKEGEVFALDFSLPMLLTGRTKISPTLDERLHIICGDGLSLPFEEKMFDACMCAWGVRNFSDIEKNLSEVRRVLKPGGYLLVIEFFKPSKLLSKVFAKTYGRYIIPAVGKFLSKNAQAYDYLQKSIQGFVSRSAYEIVLKKMGYTVEISKDLTGGIASLILARAPANYAN